MTVLEEYVRYCESKRRSQNTIKQYENHVKEFLQYVNKDQLRAIDRRDLYGYLHYIAKEKGNSVATQRSKIAALRHFYSFLMEFDYVDQDITANIEMPKVNPPVRKYLTVEQVIQVINNIDSRNKIRDTTIIMLLLTTGMRLSEVVKLNIDDIRQNFIIINGKGNKERVVYITENMKKQLQQYLLVRPDVDTNALFVSEQNNRMSSGAIRYIVNNALESAELGIDLDGVSVHTLRHTFATVNYQSGNMDIRELQETLGHSDINTTQMYVHMSEDQLKNKAEQNPLNKIF